jgi:hypothetical protein
LAKCVFFLVPMLQKACAIVILIVILHEVVICAQSKVDEGPSWIADLLEKGVKQQILNLYKILPLGVQLALAAMSISQYFHGSGAWPPGAVYAVGTFAIYWVWSYFGYWVFFAQFLQACLQVVFVRKLVPTTLRESLGQKRIFDIEVNIPSIAHFGDNEGDQAWTVKLLKGSVVQNYMTEGFPKGRTVGVVGPFNSGKTFLMHLLFGVPLVEEGLNQRTRSFCMLWLKDTVIIDTAGVHTPYYQHSIRASAEKILIDKRTTEHFATDIAFNISDYVIVVIPDLTWPMQEYVQALRTNNAKEIFLVHNWRNAKSQKEVEDLIAEQITKTFEASKQSEEKYAYYYASGAADPQEGQIPLANVRHLVLCDNNSSFGKKVNKKSTEMLKSWIDNLKTIQSGPQDPLNKLLQISLGCKWDYQQKQIIAADNQFSNPILQRYVRAYDPKLVEVVFPAPDQPLRMLSVAKDAKMMQEVMILRYNGAVEESFSVNLMGGSYVLRSFDPAYSKWEVPGVCRVWEYEIPGPMSGLIINKYSDNDWKMRTTNEERAMLIDKFLLLHPHCFVAEVLRQSYDVEITIIRGKEAAMINGELPEGTRIYGKFEKVL